MKLLRAFAALLLVVALSFGARAADLGGAIPPRYRGVIVRNRVRFFPEKLLALTFDDGPSPDVTPRVLAALKAHHAHATFFELGAQAKAHPDLVRRILADGHAIGSHSYSHPASTSLEQARSELDRTEAVLRSITGQRPMLFRPPYGLTKSNLARLALARGDTVVLWTISAADTRPVGPRVLADNIIHTPNPGDVALMHDGPGHHATAEAVPAILDQLGRAGWRFVTIPELLQAWDRWLAQHPDHRKPP